jgi:orotidine-5'-phosphate decarboxylase
VAGCANLQLAHHITLNIPDQKLSHIGMISMLSPIAQDTLRLMSRADSCAELLQGHFAAGRHLTVGLDTDPGRIPESVAPGAEPWERVVEFNRRIVAATADLAAAYKPNAAFYEALGREGFAALAETIAAIRDAAPGAAVILDAKRADIGSTNAGYVAAIFDELGADAVTVHPYLGGEALIPFLERRDKLVFVLARTSNPGAGELQDLIADGIPLYRHVARAVARDWNAAGNCGLVVGATWPEEMRAIREDVPQEMPILIPGVGAQGGDVGAAVAANREAGSDAFLVAASRSILYASGGGDFAAAARGAIESLDAEIRAAAA